MSNENEIGAHGMRGVFGRGNVAIGMIMAVGQNYEVLEQPTWGVLWDRK